MAWTTPKTWASGYVVLAADLNTHLRDNLNVTAPAVMTTAGDIIYASGANTPVRLAKSTTSTQYLANTGSSNVPAWNEVALDTGISGTLPVGNGGTGVTSFTANGALIGNTTSAVTSVDMSTKGGILAGDGSGNPSVLPVGGSNDLVLTVDADETTGMKWAAAGGNLWVENIQDFVEAGVNKGLCILGSGGQSDHATSVPIGAGFEIYKNSSEVFSGSTLLRGGWKLDGTTGNNSRIAFVTSNQLDTIGDWTAICRCVLSNVGGSPNSWIFGFISQNNPDDLANIIAFTVRTSGGTITGVCDNAGTETTRDTTVVPNGSTEATLRIEIRSGGGIVRFYRNDTQVGADVTTNIPVSTGLRLVFGQRSGSQGVQIVSDVGDMFLWREV